MLNLKITPRSVIVTKTKLSKFTDLQKISSNLRQYNGNNKAETISTRTKTKLRNCIKNITEAKSNCKEHSIDASAVTSSRFQNISTSTCVNAKRSLQLHTVDYEPLAFLITLTTLQGTTESEAKKFINIYLTQLRKKIDLYLWTVEISSGGIVHFHLLTFEQPQANWKHITKNYYRDAVQIEELRTKTQIEKATNYILKDETKENINGRKYGASKSIYNYQPITIQITTEQATKIESQIIQESEFFIVATTPKKIKKYLKNYYKSIYLDKRAVIQTSILQKKLTELASDASQGLKCFGSAVPPLVPI
jgi:hypothetical protein